MDKKILKVNDIIESVISSGKIPRPLKTTAAVYASIDCIHKLKRNGNAETVQTEVMEFFRKYGFSVAEEWIGWRISA